MVHGSESSCLLGERQLAVKNCAMNDALIEQTVHLMVKMLMQSICGHAFLNRVMLMSW